MLVSLHVDHKALWEIIWLYHEKTTNKIKLNTFMINLINYNLLINLLVLLVWIINKLNNITNFPMIDGLRSNDQKMT